MVKKVYTRYAITAAVLIVVFLLFSLAFKVNLVNDYTARIIRQIGIFSIAALGLNLILGFTGQFTLGHAAFMSIGAYTSAVLTKNFNMPFALALLAGVAMAGLLAGLIGSPILRLTGDYLAICTLGFGEIVKVFIQNIDYLGGARGFSAIAPKTTFGSIFLCLVICFTLIKNLMRTSSKGRAIFTVKEDEIAASAMGINTTNYKLLAFIIGCSMAGLAGGLYAHFNSFIDPLSFNFSQSFTLMTYVVLGGMGSLSGSIIGTGILVYLPEALRGVSDVLKNYRMLIYAILLVAMMLFRPQGILGNKEVTPEGIKKFVQNVRKKFSKKKQTAKEGE
ncbi:branched-chain amino acid ABC transporter permease [Lachnospiraceae bacterium ZAX-1]